MIELPNTERPGTERPGIDVVGVPARGPSSLDAGGRAALDAAEVIIAGRRLLSTVRPLTDAELIPLPSQPRRELTALVEQLRQKKIVVLASGDPLVAGIGSTVLDLFGADRVRILPALSSVALARARMGWSAESCEVIRPGRGAYEIASRCRPGGRLVVLSRDQDSSAEIGARLREIGFGASPMIMLSDLGTEQEQRVEGVARDWPSDPAPGLHLVCIDCRPDPDGDPQRWATSPGLPDDAYLHDGQLTKRYLRAAALVRLRPLPGELLWDLGAGAGSVAIEWCRLHPRNRAVAVERDHVRAGRIVANAQQLGAPAVEVRNAGIDQQMANWATGDLTPPDAVFLGGGATAAIIDQVMNALPAHGRLVAHAVTVESEMLLIEQHRRYGGDLTRIAVESLEPLGSHQGWKPARTVTQWGVSR